MPRKIIFLAGLAAIILILSMGLSATAVLVNDYDIRESFKRLSVIYEKLPLSDSDERKKMLDEFENQSLWLTAHAQNKETQAVGLFNAGTARLEEFLRSAENSDLEEAVDFLRQSAILAPDGSEVAKRAESNLRIASNLLAKMAPPVEQPQPKSPDKNVGNQDSGAGSQDGQDTAYNESGEVSKKNPGGITETGGMPERGEGYGRGEREKDY